MIGKKLSEVPWTFPPLTSCVGMLCGVQGCGKSYLAQSHPSALIINTDLTTVVHPNPQASMWPTISEDGRALDDNDKPIVMSWNLILQVVDNLLSYSPSNPDRPRVVFLDTLTHVIHLVKRHLEETALKGQDFDSYPGYDKWSRLTDAILRDFVWRLRNAGYGVWLLCHTMTEWEITGDTRTPKQALALYPSLTNQLGRLVDKCFPVSVIPGVQTVMHQKTMKIGGKEMSQKIPETIRVTRRVLPLSDISYHLAGITRTRTPRPMNDVDFTDSMDPWSLIDAEYRRASSPNRPEQTLQLPESVPSSQ